MMHATKAIDRFRWRKNHKQEFSLDRATHLAGYMAKPMKSKRLKEQGKRPGKMIVTRKIIIFFNIL
ncbi:hypothetical protein MCEMSEM23_02796 [Rhabdaerophilaceae bacterium]